MAEKRVIMVTGREEEIYEAEKSNPPTPAELLKQGRLRVGDWLVAMENLGGGHVSFTRNKLYLILSTSSSLVTLKDNNSAHTVTEDLRRGAWLTKFRLPTKDEIRKVKGLGVGEEPVEGWQATLDEAPVQISEKPEKTKKPELTPEQLKTFKAINEMLKLIKDIKETKDIQKLGKTFYHLFREAEGSPRYPEISYSLDGYPRLKDDDTWRIIVKLWRGEYKDKEAIKKDLKNLKAKIEKQEHKEKPKEKKQDNQLPRNIIVHCPIKEDWIKVVKQALESGCVWSNGYKEIYEHNWDDYKEESCICTEHKTITYSPKSFYSKTHPYSNYPIITAQEYLEKTKQK